MRRASFYLLGVSLLWTGSARWVAAQQEKVVQELRLRGKVVRLESPDRFIVRTSENKEVTLYANPQTRYTIDGRVARYADLKVGAEVNTVYTTRDERFYVTNVTVGTAVDVPRESDPPDRQKTTIRGKVVKVETDRLVIRADNKDVTLFTTPQARVILDGKAGRWVDLRVGTEVEVAYTVREERHMIERVVVGTTTEPVPTAEATTLQGTIIRVVGDDQVVVKTSDNKEVIIYVQPQTKYLIDEQPARFTDLRTGTDIRIQYDERDRRRIARSIFWRRK